MDKKAKLCFWGGKLYFSKRFITLYASVWNSVLTQGSCCEQWKKFSLVPEGISLAMIALWINRNHYLYSAGKKEFSKMASCDPHSLPDWSILCRHPACNGLQVWQFSALNLGRENWLWISLPFLFYFSFLCCCKLGEKSEHGKCFLWFWRQKVSGLCLASFFCYHTKEKQAYVSLESGKLICLLLLFNSALLLLKGCINFFLHNYVVEQKEYDCVWGLVKVWTLLVCLNTESSFDEDER